MAQKEELRRQLLVSRQQLSIEEMHSLSERICRLLVLELLQQPAGSIHYFEPIKASHEIDIVPAIHELQDAGLVTSLAVSRRRGGGWADVRPDGSDAPSAEQYGSVIVPMLGFDMSLHRIGYGGGYYDRFLKKQKRAIRIGVCYESGKTSFEASPYDVPMNLIVTERTVYRQGTTP